MSLKSVMTSGRHLTAKGNDVSSRNRTTNYRGRAALMAASALGMIALTGCHIDMWIQPKVKPLQQSDFFADGQASRPLVAHSVDRDHFWTDNGRYTGYEGKQVVDQFPFRITRDDLKRGEERFEIFCSPCHGRLGNGQGMIAQRGFALRRNPASYHTDKLRKAPVGHFYDVITNGFGTMYSYASRVEPDDRWRIVAYIRALQRSQNAKPTDVPADLPAEERRALEAGIPGAPLVPPSGNPNVPAGPNTTGGMQ